MNECPFCKRIAAGEYDRELSLTDQVAVFEPLNPVTPGHLLVMPWEHVGDAASHPQVTGRVMQHACWLVNQQMTDANLITSIGPDATQTVRHLHIHYVPRRPDDGLHLPWTGQK